MPVWPSPGPMIVWGMSKGPHTSLLYSEYYWKSISKFQSWKIPQGASKRCLHCNPFTVWLTLAAFFKWVALAPTHVKDFLLKLTQPHLPIPTLLPILNHLSNTSVVVAVEEKKVDGFKRFMGGKTVHNEWGCQSISVQNCMEYNDYPLLPPLMSLHKHSI